MGRVHVTDIECAGLGRTIRFDYPNGDSFVHQYRDIPDEEILRERFGDLVNPYRVPDSIRFPITVVEVRNGPATLNSTSALDRPRLGVLKW